MRNVTPSDALELYLDDKRKTSAASTIQSHWNRLSWFVDWFDDETDYDHLRELDGLDIRQWRVWRFDDHHADAYIKAVQDSLRVFLRFCRDIEAVDPQLAEKVRSPEGGKQRSAEITATQAKGILNHLDRYKYASLPHALVRTLWYCLLRVGGARALDVDDIDWEANQLHLRHRPAEGTTLKNGYDSERNIAIRPKTREILSDYIDHARNDVTDEHGRRPLFVMPNGKTRAHQNGLRHTVYAWTRPCAIDRECPHDTTQDACDATRRKNWASQCESSESTHAIRRGAISWYLREEAGKAIVSERADVQPDVLDDHYNTLTQSEKAEVRRSELPDDL